MSEKKQHRSIGDIAGDLESAQRNFEDADLKYKAASKIRSDALNLLNKFQKEMDNTVQAIREASPWDSDWKRDIRFSGKDDILTRIKKGDSQ